MTSLLTLEFMKCYSRLPAAVRAQARRSYRLWKANPSHASVGFKRVHPTEPIYSARVGLGWRALGVYEGDTVSWFWIGPHSEDDSPIDRR